MQLFIHDFKDPSLGNINITMVVSDCTLTGYSSFLEWAISLCTVSEKLSLVVVNLDFTSEPMVQVIIPTILTKLLE
jgi:hypothetical protein